MAGIHFKKKLIHTCTIQRNTPVQSVSGELIATWADVESPDCRFVQKQERLANEGLGFPILEEPIILLNDDADVIEEDRIVNVRWKTDASLVDAGPFRVDAVLDRNTGRAHHISLELDRVE